VTYLTQRHVLGCTSLLVSIYAQHIATKTFVMPESPRWLVSNDRDDEAKEVLKLCYPDGYDVSVIVNEIKDGIEKESIAEHAVGW